MTGPPPGALPTQTYSCSPTPAASFAPCKPLLCLQSGGRKQDSVHFKAPNSIKQKKVQTQVALISLDVAKPGLESICG